MPKARQKPKLTHARLQEALSYDPYEGIFTWLTPKNAGKIAGTISRKGYRLITIDDCQYRAARLALFYVYGMWPIEADHINLDPSDDRLANLRSTNRAENSQNRGISRANNSGVKGVHRYKNKWRAEIEASGKRYMLGEFGTVTEAESAIRQQRDKLHGEYANHG